MWLVPPDRVADSYFRRMEWRYALFVVGDGGMLLKQGISTFLSIVLAGVRDKEVYTGNLEPHVSWT
jgi:hypothetical protein